MEVNDFNSMVRTEGISKRVSVGDTELTILKGVDLALPSGESLAIVGESGSGKTTLLGILAGLDTPSAGRVWLDREELTELNEEQRAKVRARVVGFVFQSFQLIESLTALENVMLPSELRGDANAREVAKHFLGRVGVGKRLGHYPRQLSGGEQQRVAIARAFASDPTVLFADEPTGNLDTKTGQLVADLLFELNSEQATTLVLVTHDQRIASNCSQQIELFSGEVID